MYTSRLMISKEFLTSAMGMPEAIDVSYMDYDVARGILNLYLASGELIEGVTFEVAEGAETPVVEAGAWITNNQEVIEDAEIQEGR